MFCFKKITLAYKKLKKFLKKIVETLHHSFSSFIGSLHVEK